MNISYNFQHLTDDISNATNAPVFYTSLAPLVLLPLSAKSELPRGMISNYSVFLSDRQLSLGFSLSSATLARLITRKRTIANQFFRIEH